MAKTLTLKGALREARRKALADVYGVSDPFSAVHWMRTLPEKWQAKVEEAIVEIYHTT